MELKELLIQLQNEEMYYFDMFYEQTKKQVFYMIYSITKDYDISEELLQDTYLKFLKYKNNINPNKNILAYLLQIAKSISLNYIKKHKRTELIDSDNSIDILDETDGYSKDFDIFNIMKNILKPLEFQVVILHIVDELTHKEISKILKKPLGTITWMYQNALNKVRRIMNDGKEN